MKSHRKSSEKSIHYLTLRITSTYVREYDEERRVPAWKYILQQGTVTD